jgi:ribosome recycling factor
MAYNISALKKEVEGTREWLVQELGSLRTGRAAPALLDGVQLEVYGSRVKLNQIASVSVQDARTLYVMPYDAGQVKQIEKTITVADLGVSVGSDERGVRVTFPELTAERRTQLIKLLKGKLEEARIALKQKRTDAIKDMEKEEMGEDDTRRAKDEIQKVIDEGNKTLEEVADKKEKELEG